jgi:hypothetical protein
MYKNPGAKYRNKKEVAEEEVIEEVVQVKVEVPMPIPVFVPPVVKAVETAKVEEKSIEIVKKKQFKR